MLPNRQMVVSILRQVNHLLSNNNKTGDKWKSFVVSCNHERKQLKEFQRDKKYIRDFQINECLH